MASAGPLAIVALSTSTYTTFFRSIPRRGSPAQSARERVKLVSATHAAIVSLLALRVLQSPRWITPPKGAKKKVAEGHNLDDSENPLIQGRSDLGNALTAWEAGYLIYDTWAMLYAARLASDPGPAPSLVQVAARSPALLTHHALLAAALLYLQLYIAQGRERGIWVIVTLLLSNASNPLMHFRGWRARTKGRSSRSLDWAFVVAFAAARFGSVYWVLRGYGRYHGLGPLQSYKMLRVPCRSGLGASGGLNFVWWALLLKGTLLKQARSK